MQMPSFEYAANAHPLYLIRDGAINHFNADMASVPCD